MSYRLLSELRFYGCSHSRQSRHTIISTKIVEADMFTYINHRILVYEGREGTLNSISYWSPKFKFSHWLANLNLLVLTSKLASSVKASYKGNFIILRQLYTGQFIVNLLNKWFYTRRFMSPVLPPPSWRPCQHPITWKHVLYTCPQPGRIVAIPS